ncbi:hypothetical protein [Pseudomonas sp. AN-1]|jgi:hypothetical protein|uniref:hypothetical protein n=1 Tax=Pseudomonas sp. AN-1 TaxID=3096605 RepID=UPI002A6B3D89|nr:hypothetical protein [Pseudomonas sp. AN-1]WPP45136.1 hypothetical protein SK095_18095 [Pseudomonas sp. AN-1]
MQKENKTLLVIYSQEYEFHAKKITNKVRNLHKETKPTPIHIEDIDYLEKLPNYHAMIIIGGAAENKAAELHETSFNKYFIDQFFGHSISSDGKKAIIFTTEDASEKPRIMTKSKHADFYTTSSGEASQSTDEIMTKEDRIRCKIEKPESTKNNFSSEFLEQIKIDKSVFKAKYLLGPASSWALDKAYKAITKDLLIEIEKTHEENKKLKLLLQSLQNETIKISNAFHMSESVSHFMENVFPIWHSRSL